MKLNRLGRKSGVGFYQYETPESEAVVDADVEQIVSTYRSGDQDTAFDLQDVRQVIRAMAVEGEAVLKSGIVNDSRQVDLATIHGFGFPSHLGGAMFWARRQVVNQS